MNKMKEVAELLGVQLGEKFNLKGSNYSYYFTEDGLYSWKNDYICPSTMADILNGKYEIEKPILDEEEAEYLENVLRPFKSRVAYVMKGDGFEGEYISIGIKNYSKKGYIEHISFPWFRNGTMYKGMEVNKHYTLKELGLFEDE